MMSPRQRAAFILIDGKRSANEVVRATHGMGVVVADLEHMLALGFIAASQESAPVAARAAEAVPAEPAPDHLLSPQQELYQRAYPIATQLTAGLGLRGFRLNLAVEAASGYDDLVALFPRIEAALGRIKCRSLAQALGLP